METLNLFTLAIELAATARDHPSGRAARAIHAGPAHLLRQVVIALAAGYGLAEHENPGEATIQVVAGRVRLIAGDWEWEGGPGDVAAIPTVRHSLFAEDDAVVLLSVALGRAA